MTLYRSSLSHSRPPARTGSSTGRSRTCSSSAAAALGHEPLQRRTRRCLPRCSRSASISSDSRLNSSTMFSSCNAHRLLSGQTRSRTPTHGFTTTLTTTHLHRRLARDACACTCSFSTHSPYSHHRLCTWWRLTSQLSYRHLGAHGGTPIADSPPRTSQLGSHASAAVSSRSVGPLIPSSSRSGFGITIRPTLSMATFIPSDYQSEDKLRRYHLQQASLTSND